MFKIELLNHSSDKVFSFFWEEFLNIGNSSTDDLIIEKNNPKKIHLSLKIKTELMNNDVSLYINCLSFPFWLNGKKIIGSKRLKKNDLITVQKTKFKILDFSKFKNNDVKALYKKTIKQEPILEPLLKKLQDELIFIEGEINSEP